MQVKPRETPLHNIHLAITFLQSNLESLAHLPPWQVDRRSWGSNHQPRLSLPLLQTLVFPKHYWTSLCFQPPVCLNMNINMTSHLLFRLVNCMNKKTSESQRMLQQCFFLQDVWMRNNGAVRICPPHHHPSLLEWLSVLSLKFSRQGNKKKPHQNVKIIDVVFYFSLTLSVSLSLSPVRVRVCASILPAPPCSTALLRLSHSPQFTITLGRSAYRGAVLPPLLLFTPLWIITVFFRHAGSGR